MHHNATMKVGTDAMLLGSWINLDGAKSILDIGTGCGIISLIMAQRCEAMIDAVDVDQASVIEAETNFRFSPWSERLCVYHSDIKLFNLDKSYDLIVSNPPFFTTSFKTQQERRNLARHADSLPFQDLINATKRLLHPKGRFALVLPENEAVNFIPLAEKSGLFVHKILEIIPIEGKPVNRLNLIFALTFTESIEKNSLTIRDTQLNFTAMYHLMLKDFYLGL